MRQNANTAQSVEIAKYQNVTLAIKDIFSLFFLFTALNEDVL